MKPYISLREIYQHLGNFMTVACRRVAPFSLLFLSFIIQHPSSSIAVAGQWPSVFRGVVVADLPAAPESGLAGRAAQAGSPMGVRVVSVEESSQAYLADLRPEDLILQIHGEAVHSIDEFAVRSNGLKAERAMAVTVLVFRNGLPHALHLHLFSYPILGEWGVTFIPDFDLRFGEPRTGLDYWRRLGRGFEEAGKPREALNAYLNGLHNVPTDAATALKVTELLSRASQQHLSGGALGEGITLLRQAVHMMERLFDYPLTDEQLGTVKRQLKETLRALRTFSAAQKISRQ